MQKKKIFELIPCKHYTLNRKFCTLEKSGSNLLSFINKDNFIYVESKTTLPYSYDITLQNEDYTVGKVIESILHNEYYIKSKILSYVGFSKVHPHDSDSIVRIAFTKEASGDTIYPLITEVCLKGVQIYEKIKSYF